MGMGNASRRRGADTSYQRDDDVARYRVEAVPVSMALFFALVFPAAQSLFFRVAFRFNGNPRVFFR